jgi:hypothetical protein
MRAGPTGTADLPLHGGRVPAWLAARMARLGRVIVEAITHEYGRTEVLRRLSNPFWFQSFGAVMGMDWHSSGITTSVLGALKRGLAPVQDELGIYVCGGRGKHSRKTPHELLALGERVGIDADALVRASKLVAKVDSAALQDGFELYLHGFVTTRDGKFCVVQQGMSDVRRTARRYHWLSEGLTSFVDAPHSAIDGPNQGTIVNLTDQRAAPARAAQLQLIQLGPERVLRELRALSVNEGAAARELFATPASEEPLPHLQLPAHHEVRASDVLLRRLHATLSAAADSGPRDFAELLLRPGVGARTVLSLALVAEVVHGAPCRFADPARLAFAHGGKDGHTFTVPLAVYDETLRVLQDAVARAKLGRADKLAAIERLDHQARALDVQSGPSFDAIVQAQREGMPDWGGRTVMDDAKTRPAHRRPPRRPARAPEGQLRLPGLRRARREA